MKIINNPLNSTNQKQASKRSFLKSSDVRTLSKDYYIFAGFILVIALASSLWSALKIHQERAAYLENHLKTQTQIIDSELNNYFQYVSHIAEDKGYKIALKGADNLEQIAYLFKRNFFFPITKSGLKEKAFRWPHFSWIDKEGYVSVESESGVLLKAKKINSEQHLYESTVDNWKLHLSNPIYDPIEEEFFIDASLGVSDVNDETYIGAIFTRFEVDKLVKVIKDSLKENVEFVILNEDLEVIIKSDGKAIKDYQFFTKKISSSNNEFNIISEPILYDGNIYNISKQVPSYSFTILTGYNPNINNQEYLLALLKKGVEFFGAAFFILAILYFQHRRIINPIQHLANVVRRIAKGEEGVEIRECPKNSKKIIKYSYEIHKFRESVLFTKIFMERERKSRKLAEKKKAELTNLNIELEHKNDVANQSKKYRDKFLSEIRCRTVEAAVIKMAEDVALLMSYEQGDFAMNKSALNDLYEKMLGRCSRILSYISDELVFSPVNIQEIIEESVAMQKHDADINNVDLLISMKSNLPDIYVDEKAIKHIVTSLIFYAMEDRKRNRSDSFVKLTISCKKHRQDKSLIITLEDNGCGISEEMRLEFEKHDEKEGVLGNNIALSLYAVRHLLELHQAALEIVNTPGKGSLITVTIPYINPSQNQEALSDELPENMGGEVIDLFPSRV